jgi:hypothetical protein
VALELGGKSPVVVDSNVDLHVNASLCEISCSQIKLPFFSYYRTDSFLVGCR